MKWLLIASTLLLVGCFELPTPAEVSELEVIGRLELKVAINHQIVKPEGFDLPGSQLCAVVVHLPDFREYEKDTVVSSVVGLSAIRDMEYDRDLRNCYHFAVMMCGYIAALYPDIAFGTISYRRRIEGWQHAVNILYSGGILWLIDPRSCDVYTFDKSKMEAYSIVF